MKKSLQLALVRWLFTPLAGVRLGNWLRLLRHRGASISPRSWPRAAFTTLMALLNSVLARIQFRRHGREVEAARVSRPVFVLGHHRSGTTHLWNLLAQDPQFASPTVLQAVFPHTFLLLEKFIRGAASLFTPGKRPQDGVAFAPDSPLEDERALCTATFLSIQMARHFPRQRSDFLDLLGLEGAAPAARRRWQGALDQFARALAVRHGHDKTLLFKSPDHTAKVRLILELYPDARFIHITRNPYHVYRSTMKMEEATLPLYAYQHPDPETLEDFVLWRYRRMYEAFFRDLQRIPPGQLSTVSFEDLETTPLDCLERIYRELDLPAFSRARPAFQPYLASVAGYRKNGYPDLPKDARQRITERWGPIFRSLQYSPEHD